MLRAPGMQCCQGAETVWQNYRNIWTQLSYSGECIQMESPPRKKRNCLVKGVYTAAAPKKKTLKTSQCPVTGNKSKEVSRTSTQWNNMGPSYIIINEEHIHNIKQCNSKIILILYKNYIWKKLCM